MKHKKKLITLNPATEEMLLKIKENFGNITISEAIRQSIIFTYDKITSNNNK